MQLKTHTGGSVGVTHPFSPVLRLKGFLALSVETNDPNYLVRKEYVDATFSDIPAQSITTGTLSVHTLRPAITGDMVVKGDGRTYINKAVPQGTFPKVSVSAKGLVTVGSLLNQSDLPATLAYSIFTSGKPTTAGGYGITDAVLSTGGALTGNLKLVGAPQSDKHAATKGYVTGLVSLATSSHILVGDMVLRRTTPTPDGYLQCNGGYISKTTYASLYATLGASFNHPTDSSLFSIPDLTSIQPTGHSFFIKY